MPYGTPYAPRQQPQRGRAQRARSVRRRPLSFAASTAPCFTVAGQENFTAMVAAFGTGGVPHLNRRLVSDTPRLRLRSLPLFGKSVTLTWENPARAASAPLTRVSRTAEGIVIETGGTSVTVAVRQWPMPIGRGGDHGIRERMVCPRCESSRDVLHWVAEVGWGCRAKDCLDLEHNCRHEQRWCPAIRRRARLLHKLTKYSPRGLKARLLRAQIAQQEAAMLANMKRANRDLTKRMNRHGGQR